MEVLQSPRHIHTMTQPKDITNTAITLANDVMKMEQIQKQFSAGLEVKLNMTQEFQPIFNESNRNKSPIAERQDKIDSEHY